MRDLLLVGFLLVAIFYAFKRPYIGVAAWAWIALIAPANWAFGFSRSLRLNLTIVLVTALAYLFASKKKSFQLNALGFWVLMFAIWTLVSTYFNLSASPAWVWAYWNQFIKVLLLFVFIVLTINKRLHIDTLIWAFVLAISSYAAMEAVKFIISGGSHRITGRAGIIEDRNDLAVAINMCIPLVIYLIQVTKHKWLKLGLCGLLALNILSIVGTYSRGGFIGLAIVGFVFWLKSNHKMALAVVALILLPILFDNAPEEWRDRQSTVTTAADQDSSFIGRLWAWKISTMIALDHPFTGGGFGAVTERHLWNYYAPFTPAFSPLETIPIPENQSPKAAHNVYFQVLGDHGFVGLGIFLMIMLLALLNNIKNAKVARQHDVLWYRQLANAITLSLVGYGITAANVSLAYFDLVYAMFALVAVMTIHREKMLSLPEPSARRQPHMARSQMARSQTARSQTGQSLTGQSSGQGRFTKARLKGTSSPGALRPDE